MEQVTKVITRKLEILGPDPTFQSKRKAINSLFPYAVRLARDGQRGMVDVILRIASNSTSGGFAWRRIGPYITTWFDESSPPYLNQAIALASPFAGWVRRSYTQSAVVRWAAAALATPYSAEIGQSVVDALLQIAWSESLRPHIPTDVWALLKMRPHLPPVCPGRSIGQTPHVVHYIRRLGDIEILKSYFLLVWSEWETVPHIGGHAGAEAAITEEFCGIEKRHHRQDLMQRLDYIQGQLDLGLEHFKQHQPWIEEYVIEERKEQYKQLREVLVEVERSAMDPLSCTPHRFILLHNHPNFSGCVQNPSRVRTPTRGTQILCRRHSLDLREFSTSFYALLTQWDKHFVDRLLSHGLI